MTSPSGPICDHCRKLLPNGKGVVAFFFVHEIFCSRACLEAQAEERSRKDNQKVLVVRKYGRTRFWGVYDGNGDLITVTVYKKGAQEVQRRLSTRR